MHSIGTISDDMCHHFSWSPVVIPRKTLPLVLRAIPALLLAACGDGPTAPDSGPALQPIVPYIVMFDDSVTDADAVSARLE